MPLIAVARRVRHASEIAFALKAGTPVVGRDRELGDARRRRGSRPARPAERSTRAPRGASSRSERSARVADQPPTWPLTSTRSRAYAERDPGRFHVPGHKGGPGADPGLREAIGERALALDIPALTPGSTSGPASRRRSSARRSSPRRRGARARSWFMVNGASQGNHVALLALAHHGGRDVVVQRNAHSSTIDALVLVRAAADVRRPRARPRASGRALHHAGDARRGARGDAGRRRRDDRLADLLRRGRRRAGAGRGRARARRAADRRRVVGRAPRLPPERCRRPRCRSAPTSSSRARTRSSGARPSRRSSTSAAATSGSTRTVVDRCVTLLESTSPSSLLAARSTPRGGCGDRRARAARADARGCRRSRARRCARSPGSTCSTSGSSARPGVHGYDPLRLVIDVRAGASGYELSRDARGERRLHGARGRERAGRGVRPRRARPATAASGSWPRSRARSTRSPADGRSHARAVRAAAAVGRARR